MGELHVFGQILKSRDFSVKGLFCKWYFQFGNGWKVISGQSEGQTQVDEPLFSEDCLWNFPLDVHFVTKTIQGWPKIYLQVFHFDPHGRSHLYGYGYLNVPTTPGEHSLTCGTWRPVPTWSQRVVQFFLGGAPQLTNPDLIYSSNDRYKLTTESMGSIQFELNILMRNFEKFGVQYK